jgi:hypothetical protein
MIAALLPGILIRVGISSRRALPSYPDYVTRITGSHSTPRKEEVMKRFALTLAAGLLVFAVASAANAAHHGPHHRGPSYHAYRAPHHGAQHYRHHRYHHGYHYRYHHVPKPYYGHHYRHYRPSYHGVYRPVYPGCSPYRYSQGGFHIGGPHYSFGIRW